MVVVISENKSIVKLLKSDTKWSVFEQHCLKCIHGN